MRIAAYGRKSVYSDKSDSIDNQFKMCRAYCDGNFTVDSWREFQDEAFSGKNINRPGLKLLMSAVRNGEFDAVVVYQLDRFSRDVRDFANLYSALDEHGVKFISLKERIDTTSPIGKAMMYITAVFAQMERETIATRVADNMRGLAAKGFWVQGQPPVGYTRQRIESHGKKHYVLTVSEPEAEHVRWLFEEFLRHTSLCAMERDFRKRGIRNRSGSVYSSALLYNVLSSPFCVPADQRTLEYFRDKGSAIFDSDSEWDGTHAVMVYGKFRSSTGKQQRIPITEWQVCAGRHQPIVSTDLWLAVQNRFGQNKFVKAKKYPPTLLTGVLRCSCGRLMQVSTKPRRNGTLERYYYCPRRARDGLDACDRRMIKCELLDEKVMGIFREIGTDRAAIERYIADGANTNEPTESPDKIKAEIGRLETKIGRLAQSLSDADGSAASRYIIAEMERLDGLLTDLRLKLNSSLAEQRKRRTAQQNVSERVSEVESFIAGLDGFDAEERNRIVRKLIQECTWDGENLFVRL